MADVPLYEYDQNPIADGTRTIRPLTISNVPEPMWGTSESIIHVVLAHGAWGGPITMAPLMRQFVRAAGVEDQDLTATLYRDPWFGFGRYAADHRTARFEQVVRATADTMDMPVHMAAHSWAGRGSIEVAERAAREQIATSFIAYTITNRIDEGNMTFRAFLEGGLRELASSDGIAGLRSVVTVGAIGASAVTHSMLSLPTAVAECSNAFNSRITSKLTALQNVLRTGVVLADCDAFFGDGEAASAHLRDAGFEGAIGVMEHATHASAVSNYRHGESFFEVVQATVHPELESSRPFYPA